MSAYKLFFGCFFLLSANGFSQATIINDPNAQVRDVKESFQRVEVSNAIDLYLSQGTEETVVVSAKDLRYRDLIRTVVENGTLRIFLDKQQWRMNNGNKKLKAYVSCKTLDGLGASGASNIYIKGAITGEGITIHLSGASDFKGSVKYKQLIIHQSGASDVSIDGMVNDLTIQSSGASDIKGFDLITDNCTVSASGASDISITVNKELSAHASGASSINYKGSGTIKNSHLSGASNVSKRG